MQGLLSSVEWPEPQLRADNLRTVENFRAVEHIRAVEPLAFTAPIAGALGLSESQIGILREIQMVLHRHGLDMELWEVVQMVMGAISARPSLCRNLLSTYPLDS